LKPPEQFDISKLQEMAPEYLATLRTRSQRKTADLIERSMDQVTMDENQRAVSQMKY